MTGRLFLATCSELPNGAEDEAELMRACVAAGIDASWQVWDAPGQSYRPDDLVVIRSSWDYTSRRDEFLDWADALPVVANPANVLRWNSDKTYLRTLATAGIAVVPTTWAAPGEQIEIPPDVDFVVKPAIGAGSMGAGRFTADDSSAARAHAAALHDMGRTVMVQPYLADVDVLGESALIFIDGAYSHSVRKGAMLPRPIVHAITPGASRGLFALESIRSRDASETELAVAATVLAQSPGADELLYARVDLLPSSHGPVLIELELTEPSLFLAFHPPAAYRLAEAIAARLHRRAG
jgi:hypothetical protein